MSKYTTEVRFICESNAGLTESEGFNNINQIIVNSAPQIFNFDFPIFDEDYRLPLEVKILRHYYTREICEETVGLWKLRLQDRLNMIMPYYNQLYQSLDYEFNPFHDVDLDISRRTSGEMEGQTNDNIDRTEHTDTENENVRDSGSERTGLNERDTTDNGTRTSANQEAVTNAGNESSRRHNTGSSDDLAWQLYSDTPQGDIDGIQGWEDVSDGEGGTVRVETLSPKYLTNAQKNTGLGHTTGDETASSENSGSSNRSANSTDTTNSNTKDNQKYAENINANELNKGRASGDVTGNERRSSTNNITNTEQYIEKITGKRNSTSYARLLMEYRESLINIDEMIIDELSDLFFALW